MSRGAENVTFVEMSRNALTVLAANIALTRCPYTTILPVTVDKALRKLTSEKAQFDLVFMDPPYGKNMAYSTMHALVATPLLDPKARIVAEHESRMELPAEFGPWLRTDVRKYGDTTLSIYARIDDLF